MSLSKNATKLHSWVQVWLICDYNKGTYCVGLLICAINDDNDDDEEEEEEERNS